MSRSNCITFILCLVVWANTALHASADTANAMPSPSLSEGNTLLEVSKAESIQIMATGTTTSITVKGLDNTSDNFYYNADAKMDSGNSTLLVDSNDIRNVTVKETNRQITISYVDSEGNGEDYAFSFTDPENRVQSSYIGKQWSDFAINLAKSGKVKWDVISMGLSLGWVTATKPAPDFGNSMGRSVELSWLMIAGVQMSYRSFSIAAGLGVDWRNFVTKGERYFFKNPDGKISLETYDPEMTHRRSRIKVFSLQLPVLATVNFGHKKHWGVTAGPIVNFNTSGSIKTQYEIADESYSVKTSHIGQRPVTVDAYFAIHYNGFGLYARYSPMNMLKSSTDLDFGAFSTGIALIF